MPWSPPSLTKFGVVFAAVDAIGSASYVFDFRMSSELLLRMVSGSMFDGLGTCVNEKRGVWGTAAPQETMLENVLKTNKDLQTHNLLFS